jgi:PD-(D/E)XK nuclease superfamily protein
MRLTASSLEKASACAYPWRPDVPEPPASPQHPAAELGTEVHDMIARYLDGVVDGPEPSADAAILYASWLRWWESDAAREACPVVCAVEVPLAFDVVTHTARMLRSVSHRDYSDAGPNEICGTADLVTAHPGGFTIWDWKTSKWGAAYTTHPARNKQTGLLSLCWARIHGCEAVRAGLGFIGRDETRPEVAELDTLDLDAIEHDVSMMHARLQSAEPIPWDYRSDADNHCRWCSLKAAGTCPAFAPVPR